MLLIAACGDEAQPLGAPAEVGQAGAIERDDSGRVAARIRCRAPYLFRDTVTIELEPETEIIYVVQPGDTLGTITAKFCVTVAEVQRLNTIVDVDMMRIGDELRIPIREGACGDAAPRTEGDAEVEQAAPSERPGEVYVVREGDTLAQIAAAYGFSWFDIANYNGISEAEADTIYVGQELIHPAGGRGGRRVRGAGGRADRAAGLGLASWRRGGAGRRGRRWASVEGRSGAFVPLISLC